MIAARIMASGTQMSSKKEKSFGILYLPITERGTRSLYESIKTANGIDRRSEMKNYEKYAEEIREYKGQNFCEDFIEPCILRLDNCNGLSCYACQLRQMIWLLEDYKEPKTDWSKVRVDTPILVRNIPHGEWEKRYFAKYEDGEVFAWGGGYTSWTTSGAMTPWKYAKLAESEEGGAK